MAPNLALLIEVSDFKGTIKSTAKSSAGLRVDGERRKEKKYKRGGGKHRIMTTVSTAVGTRTVIPLLILIMWQNLMLMSESKLCLIFCSEIFASDTRIKFIKKTWKVSIG